MNRRRLRLVIPPLLGFAFVAVLVTWQVRSLSEPVPISYEPVATSLADPTGLEPATGNGDEPSTESSTGADDSPVQYLDGVAGTADDAQRVVTDVPVAGEAGDLLVAAIATKPARSIELVEGLGLEWREVRTQCAGRGTTELSVWVAVADDAVTGEVAARLSSGTADVALLAARYTGADPETPIGSAVGANVHDDPARCEGGTDEPTLELVIDPMAAGSRTVVFAAARQFEVAMAPPLVGRETVRSATDGSAAGLTAGDDLVGPGLAPDGSLEPRIVGGTIKNGTDWAAVAIEVLADGQRVEAPTIGLSTAAIDFGATPPLVEGEAQVLQKRLDVRNDGAQDLVVTSVSIEGPDADQFAVIDAEPFTLGAGESQFLMVEFRPDRPANASAVVRIASNDRLGAADVRLTGRGGPLPDGMWISADELADIPMEGPAWDGLLAAADGEVGVPNLADFVAKDDVRTLAVALVYARTGGEAYRVKARDAIVAAIGTEIGATTAVQPCRNLSAYVIAADLIGLPEFDPESDAVFRRWIDRIRYVEWPDGSFVQEDEERANNHGRMCGMSRAAVAIYLDDGAELAATADAFARFLGDTSTDGEFLWRHDLSWQADPEAPVGINPAGAQKDGVSIDGALPEEMRRGGPFQIPPVHTGYPWEALQGAVVEAVLLDRAGYDVFDWSDRALLRSVEFLAQLHESYPQAGWWASGDDTWVPWVINDVYGTGFATEPANIGKSMGWTDWTHAPD